MGNINISEVRLTEEEIQAAVEVLRSGKLRQGGSARLSNVNLRLRWGRVML